MLEALRLLKEILASEKEIRRAKKRLELAELDYGALQVMIDNAVAKNVKVEIRNGTNIVTIVPTEPGKMNFRSFKDRYETLHTGGK